MVVTVVTPQMGFPSVCPGPRASSRHRQTQTHTRELADFRPGPRNASWDAKGGGGAGGGACTAGGGAYGGGEVGAGGACRGQKKVATTRWLMRWPGMEARRKS